MRRRNIPYQTVTDNKGPFIFFLYALLGFKTPFGHPGIFLCDLFAVLITFRLMYKSSRLFAPVLPSILFTLSSVLLFFSHYTRAYGNPETFAMPLYAIITYWILSGEYREGNTKKVFLISVWTGMLLFTKQTLAVYPICAFLYYLIFYVIPEKHEEELKTCITGILIPTGIVVLYGIFTGSLSDMIRETWINSISYSGNSEGFVLDDLGIKVVPYLFILIVLQFSSAVVERKIDAMAVTVSIVIFVIIQIVIPGRMYDYYTFPFYGMMFLPFLSLRQSKSNMITSMFALILTCVVTVQLLPGLISQGKTNRYFMRDQYTNLKQVNEIVGNLKEDSGIFCSSATTMSVQNINCKLTNRNFFRANSTYSMNPDMWNEWIDGTENGDYKLIISLKKKGSVLAD